MILVVDVGFILRLPMRGWLAIGARSSGSRVCVIFPTDSDYIITLRLAASTITTSQLLDEITSSLILRPGISNRRQTPLCQVF
jgi:hypothetical protein